MALEQVVTGDSADLELLGLANEKGKFAIAINYPMKPHMQDAFERGIDYEYFTFVDLSPVECVGGSRMMRVFRLTEKGRARLKQLRH